MADRSAPLWRALRATLETLVLAAVFFMVLTPIALLRRLIRPDPLHQQPDPDADSYWVPREKKDSR